MVTLEALSRNTLRSPVGGYRPAVIDVRTQTDQINASIAPERIFAAVTAGLAFSSPPRQYWRLRHHGLHRRARVNEIGIAGSGAQASQVLLMILRGPHG